MTMAALVDAGADPLVIADLVGRPISTGCVRM
jgi:hypothetical protein